MVTRGHKGKQGVTKEQGVTRGNKVVTRGHKGKQGVTKEQGVTRGNKGSRGTN